MKRDRWSRLSSRYWALFRDWNNKHGLPSFLLVPREQFLPDELVAVLGIFCTPRTLCRGRPYFLERYLERCVPLMDKCSGTLFDYNVKCDSFPKGITMKVLESNFAYLVRNLSIDVRVRVVGLEGAMFCVAGFGTY